MPKQTAIRRRLSREERRNLDVEISFLEGLVRRDPAYTEALGILGDDYTRRGRIREGLDIDRRLSQLRPDDALVHYNLGCSFALNGDFEEAGRAIERALDLGFGDYRWLARDPDLAELRRHPAYRRIRARIRALKARVA